MNRNHIIMAVTALILTLAPGCSIQQYAVRTAMNPIIDGGMESMMAETNLKIAKTALESNLKLIEGILRTDPDNEELLLAAAEGYTGYTMGFVEDDSPIEARDLYRRARGYANRWLIEEEDADLLAIQNLQEFEAAVADLDEEAVPGAFWLANSWGSLILISLDDIAMVSQLPKVEALMRFVLEHDPAYYFATAHLFFGGYYGARPPMLGGDPAKAQKHLETQIDMTDGNVLLGYLFMVKYVHLRALNEEAALRDLDYILSFDVMQAPENTRLLNRIAQEKARDLLARIDEYL